MWLYKLTNKINGKGYVGTSVNPISQRLSRHLYAANSGRKDMAIACAIRKYGLDAFEVECLAHTDDYEQLLQMEIAAIKEHGTLFPYGYNISEGGQGSRRACSETTRAKISARTKGRKAWNLGKKLGPLSEDQKIKLSERSARKGKPAINRGIPWSEETRQKMKSRVPWNKGKKTGPMSEEQKQKIAETVSKVRATRFWSSRTSKKENHYDQTIQ